MQQTGSTPHSDAVANAVTAAGGLIFVLLYLAVVFLTVAGTWRVLSKAGHPGWAVLVPPLCFYFLIKIAGKPDWWLLLLLYIPCIDLIIAIIVINGVARNFGKGVGFTIGLLLLPFIFWPILGFGDSKFQGTAAPAPAA